MNHLRAAVLALFFPIVAWATTPAEEFASRFISVFRSDDLAQLAALGDPTQREPRAWEDIRTSMDKYDCIRIERWEWSVVSQAEDRFTLQLRIDGSGTLKAPWKPERRLPRLWNVEARLLGKAPDGNWRLWRAISEERKRAYEMAIAPSVEEAERIANAASDVELDRLMMIAMYGDELDYASRRERFEHALALARETGDVATEIDVLRNHALDCWGAPCMLLSAEQAVALSRARGSKDDLAGALLTLGLAQLMVVNRAAAARTYAEGASLFESLDDPIRAAKCQQMYMYAAMDTLAGYEMLREVERFAEQVRRIGWEDGIESSLSNEAQLHFRLGNLERTRELYREEVRLTERHGSRAKQMMALYNIANMEIERDDMQKAVELYEALLEHPYLDTWLAGESREMLAYAQMELGRYDEALRTVDAVDAVAVEPSAARLSIRANIHLRRGDVDRAILLAEEAVRVHRPPTDGTEHRSRARYLGILAEALNARGRRHEAIEALRGSIVVIENAKEQWGSDALGLTKFLEGYVRFYVDLVESLVACGDADEAFRVAEQMKSRGLREAIETAHIDLSSSLSEEEKAREAALVGRVVEINRAMLEARQKEKPTVELELQLAEARMKLDTLRSEIRLAHPAVSRRRVDAEFGFELPPSDDPLALVEYVVTPTQVIAFTKTRGASVRATTIPIARTKLERDVREIENLLAARSPEYRAMARKLYDTLLAPIEREFPTDATVVIIPDGVLWNVPFHALVRRDGGHVIDRHPIFYAHSLHLLRQASSLRSSTQPRLLALGNPRIGTTARSTLTSAFRNTPLDTLIDAEVEVRSVSSMYPSEGQRVFYGAEATELAFKNEAPRFSVIHIAAHALVDDRAPLYSAIVLAQGRGSEDGLLEAREVVDLPLSADLAVLSACDTARGKVRAGEGVIGLSWAFFAAGCPTTVVSQWRAESAATAQLMIELHRRLRAGDSTAEAIRRAQIAVRATPKYRHPFYWAPFIAVGAAEH